MTLAEVRGIFFVLRDQVFLDGSRHDGVFCAGCINSSDECLKVSLGGKRLQQRNPIAFLIWALAPTHDG